MTFTVEIKKYIYPYSDYINQIGSNTKMQDMRAVLQWSVCNVIKCYIKIFNIIIVLFLILLFKFHAIRYCCFDSLSLIIFCIAFRI